jgi:hypothetical protein
MIFIALIYVLILDRISNKILYEYNETFKRFYFTNKNESSKIFEYNYEFKEHLIDSDIYRHERTGKLYHAYKLFLKGNK